MDKWARIALESGWPSDWIEGAIFPREMVYFLARCESEGITCILESGRQDGISTKILGQFAAVTGCKVISLDVEEEAERARAARSRLLAYPVLCVKGDAFIDTDRIVVANAPDRMALLFDGPKGFSAMAVMFAAARHDNVRLIAEHNIDSGTEARELFAKFAPGPIVYEEESSAGLEHWGALARAERNAATARHAVRSVEESSLCVLTVNQVNRRMLYRSIGAPFGFFQPLVLSTLWARGQYAAAAQLFAWTFRISAWMGRFLRPRPTGAS